MKEIIHLTTKFFTAVYLRMSFTYHHPIPSAKKLMFWLFKGFQSP